LLHWSPKKNWSTPLRVPAEWSWNDQPTSPSKHPTFLGEKRGRSSASPDPPEQEGPSTFTFKKKKRGMFHSTSHGHGTNVNAKLRRNSQVVGRSKKKLPRAKKRVAHQQLTNFEKIARLELIQKSLYYRTQVNMAIIRANHSTSQICILRSF